MEEDFENLHFQLERAFNKVSITEKSQFRNNVSDLLKNTEDNEFLFKWLRARNFDQEKAEKMLREHMKFRKRIGFDTLLIDFELPEVIQRYNYHAYTGSDKEGRAVIVWLVGKIDLRGMVRSLDMMQIVKSSTYVIEKALQSSMEENKKTGKKSNKGVLIFDCKDMKMQQLWDRRLTRLAMDLARILQANYPETLSCCYVINVPKFLYFWYNLVKYVLDPVVQKKVKFYDCNGWRKDILEEIGANALPTIYGGDVICYDGNLECDTKLDVPEKIPESYYVVNDRISVTKDPEMTKVVVPERAYFNLKVQVQLPDHAIRWRFQTLYHDISYSLYYIPSEIDPMSLESFPEGLKRNFRNKEKLEELLPVGRTESHIFPEEGEFQCLKTGTYLLHFDNTFSWITPKELYYKVEVIPASSEISCI